MIYVSITSFVQNSSLENDHRISETRCFKMLLFFSKQFWVLRFQERFQYQNFSNEIWEKKKKNAKKDIYIYL